MIKKTSHKKIRLRAIKMKFITSLVGLVVVLSVIIIAFALELLNFRESVIACLAVIAGIIIGKIINNSLGVLVEEKREEKTNRCKPGFN